MVKTILKNRTGEIYVFPAYFSDENPLEYLEAFELRQESIRLFGKEVMQPRLSALYGFKGTNYKYSGKRFEAIPWSGWLEQVAKTCTEIAETPFNTVLLNYYRNGMDSMGLHADDEKELGSNPVIASVSFGAARSMIFRNKTTGGKKIVTLEHGDLLVMRGALQHQWKHELPKEKRVNEARLNLTFRWVQEF